ncbi:MAG: trigger factor [Oscillospiraceae bacterium]
MALIEHNKIEDGKYLLVASIEKNDFLSAVEKVYRRENKKITIPGFRKGKAPRNILEKMYGESFFYEDAVNELLPECFEKAIDETKIKYVGRPEVDVTEVDKEKGATVKFTVTLRPELAVKKYKGLAATKYIDEVKPEDVDDRLKEMLEENVRVIKVESGLAENGDIANIDFEGFVDDVAFSGGKGEKYDLTLGGHQFIEGFEEQVTGHAIGDEFDVNVTFPEDYNAKELAGKVAVFKTKLNELSKKEYLPLDDDFAKDVSEFDTLDELKKDIEKKAAEDREEKAKAQLENDLVEEVAKSLEGDVPPVMIEDKIDDLIKDFDYRLSSQGLDINKYLKYTGFDMEHFRETFKEQAEKQVKQRLALEAVALAEKISIEDGEVDKEYDRLAKLYTMDIEQVKNLLRASDLEEDLLANKAIDFVLENAKIKVAPTAEREEKKDAQ